jgi:hypothetical protein
MNNGLEILSRGAADHLAADLDVRRCGIRLAARQRGAEAACAPLLS